MNHISVSAQQEIMTLTELEEVIKEWASKDIPLPNTLMLNVSGMKELWKGHNPAEIKIPPAQPIPLCGLKIVREDRLPDGVILGLVDGRWVPICLPEPKQPVVKEES